MENKNATLVVGLTGGIGSGKSTASGIFSTLGIDIIDADQIAREVVKPSKPLFSEIVEHFGPDVLTKNKEINREKLREIIFQDQTQKNWLETLLHPMIRKEIQKRLKNINSPYSIVVIPLLFETKNYDFLHRILVIDTTPELQIKRTQERDKCTAEHVKSIMQCQISRNERLAKANDVVVNNGDLVSLQQRIVNLHHYYLGLVNAKQGLGKETEIIC